MWFTYSIISAFLGSISMIVEKKILQKEHTFIFSVSLSVLCAIIFSPVIFIYSPAEYFTLESISLVYLSSIFATVAFLEVTKGIRHLDISFSAPMFLLAPIMTAGLAFVLIGETLSYRQVTGMLVIATGTYIIQTKSLRDYKGFLRGMSHNKYLLHILFGLALYSLTSIIDKIMVSHYAIPPALYISVAQVFIAINFISLFLYRRFKIIEIKNLIQNNFWLILCVAIATVGYRLSQQIALLLSGSVALVITVKRTSSLFTTIVGGKIFSEKNLLRKFIACLIMIVGLFIVSL